MGKNISHLKIGSETYDLRPYAVCSSGAYNEDKIVDCPGFTIHEGAEITILFENGNLYWDDFVLNINGGDDIFVGINGDEYHGGKIFPPNTTHTFRYDGTRWEMISYNGLYPTINCTHADLCNFAYEDILVPGQTYQIAYNPTIYSEDVEYYGDFNPSYTSIRSGLTPCSLVLTATSSHQFDEKVNVVNVSTDIKKNTNATWDVWYSLIPTRKASWAGNRTIHVYDVDGETYDFCDAVYVWFNNKKYYIGHTVNTENVIYLEYGISNYYGESLYIFNGASMMEYSTVDEYHDEYYSFYGVITRLIDEYDNDLPYDFKNIYFKGYNLFSDTIFATNTYYPTFTVSCPLNPFGLDASVSGHAHGNKIKRCYKNGYGVLNQNMFIKKIAYNDYKDKYICNNTFGYGCYKNLFKGPSKGISFGNDCHSNKFGSECQGISFGNGCYQNNIGDSVINCSFGNGCNLNEIGNSSLHNSFGNYCYSNKIDYSSKGNSFGNYCYSNKLGYNSHYNSFGNHCYSNTLDYYSHYNSFGNNCYSNKLGYNSISNSFGNNCYSNTFGTNFNYNSIGNDCNSISFGNNCNGNKIGNFCNNIAGGTYCFYNTFGNYCRFIYFKTSKSSSGTDRNFCYYNNVDSGVDHIVLYNTTSASASYKLQNAHVYSGYSPNTNNYKYAGIGSNLTAKCIVRNSSDTSVTLQS